MLQLLLGMSSFVSISGAEKIKIPGYKIERLIAEGGMATVYLATHESLGRYVALKLLRKFENINQSKRFLAEGRILAALHHKNIITIYDIGVTDSEQPYISMEYLEGGDLEARIEKGMAPADALKVVNAIADCLSLVHSEGIIHRDIKPANILFHKDGTPILTDFGIAKQEDRDTRLTMEGSAFGSPYYLSPEQAECKTLDGRADIYGLGIVLYEMLTGNKPYKGDSHIETIVAHLSNALPELPPELSKYQDLVHKMIAKSPSDRFPNAGEVVQYVRQLRVVENTSPTPILDKKISKSMRKPWVGKKTGKPQPRQPSGAEARQKNSISRTEKILWSLAGILTVVLTITGSFMWKQQQATVISTEYTDDLEPATNDSAMIDDVKSVDSHIGTERTSTVDDAETLSKKPELLPRVKSDTSSQESERIKEYLAKANLALKESRLMLPRNNNAYYYYQRILDIHPNHKGSFNGFKKIANAYADLAENELNRFNYANANMYIRKGLKIQPDNKRLLELKRDTKVLKEGPEWVINKIKSLFK